MLSVGDLSIFEDVRASLGLSRLTLLASTDGLGPVTLLKRLTASSGIALAEELDGRVGGDGGAPTGERWVLLGACAVWSQREDG
jgi:hypothetical protein